MRGETWDGEAAGEDGSTSNCTYQITYSQFQGPFCPSDISHKNGSVCLRKQREGPRAYQEVIINAL